LLAAAILPVSDEAKLPERELDGVPVISIVHSDLSVKYYRAAKRLFDIVFSLFFLVLIFPVLFFIVSPAIWLSGRGPIFFKQLRKGYKQEPFFLLQI